MSNQAQHFAEAPSDSGPSQSVYGQENNPAGPYASPFTPTLIPVYSTYMGTGNYSTPSVPSMQQYYLQNHPASGTNKQNVGVHNGQQAPVPPQPQMHYPQWHNHYGNMASGPYPFNSMLPHAPYSGYGHQNVQAPGFAFGYSQQHPYHYPGAIPMGYTPQAYATTQQDQTQSTQQPVPQPKRDQSDTDSDDTELELSRPNMRTTRRPSATNVKGRHKQDNATPVVSSDSECESVTENTSVYVKGLTNASANQVELFFEGSEFGGDVKSVTCNRRTGVAIVEFRSTEDVQKVLRKATKSGGKLPAKSLGQIKVFQYDPNRHQVVSDDTGTGTSDEDSDDLRSGGKERRSENKPSVLLIQGVSAEATDEALRLYFEAKHKLEPTTIYRGDAADAVLVEFHDRLDIRRFKDVCKKYTCCGNTLEVDLVPECKCVKVTGFDTDTRIDMLENYFENKRRSGGGNVDNVRFLENEDAAVVTFKFESDARAVCTKTQHSLKEKPLQTVLYHQRLYPTKPKVVAIPEPIQKVVNEKHVVQLFNNSNYFKEIWQGEAKEIFGKLTFLIEPTQLKISLHCDVDPKDTNASQKVHTWINSGQTFLDNKLAIIDVTSIVAGDQIFRQVRQKIGEINVAEPNKLALMVNSTNATVDIVGERKSVAELRLQIKRVVDEQQVIYESENRQVNETVALKEHEVTLLTNRDVKQSLETSDVGVRLGSEGIVFTGKRSDVECALSKLDKVKQNMRQIPLSGFEGIVINLLERDAVRAYIDKEIERTGVPAIWKTKSDGVVMYLYALNNGDVDRVVLRFRSLVRYTSLQLSKDEHEGLLSSDGQSFLKTLKEQFENDIVIRIADNCLQYACLKPKSNDVETEIKSFLDSTHTENQFVDANPSKCEVLKRYCDAKVSGIAKKHNVKIDQQVRGRKWGFVISGTSECVDKACDNMNRLVRNVKQSRLEYKWPGFRKFAMQSKNGKSTIEKIQQEEKCIIIIDGQHVQEPQILNEEIEVQIAGAIKLEIVMKGSIFQNKADAIVNSTSTDLDMNKGAMSKQLLKEAGQGVQDECRKKYPGGIQHGEVAVTSPGRLSSCQRIFHVALPRFHSDQDIKVLRKYVLTCLRGANDEGDQTICFPALGTGMLGYPADAVAKTMTETIQKYGQDNPQSNIKRVAIFVYEKDEKTKQAFKDHVGVSSAEGVAATERTSRDRPDVQLTVFYHKEQSEQSIKDKIGRIHRVDEIFLSASLIEKLTKDKMQEVKKIAGRSDVKAKCEKSTMKLYGYGKSVAETKAALQDYLKKLDDAQPTSGAIQFPSSWGKMTINDAPKNVALAAGSNEYNTVANKFCGDYAAANIVQIDCVQNPQLYVQYLAKKKQIEKNCTRPNCEQKLWHGTRTPQIADNICLKGFDRNYNSGAAIGVGVYFAVNASMSATGYTAPDAMGQRYIFYADVLTGDYGVGSGSIRVPPPKVPGNNLVTFDSTTDNVNVPSMFAIFNDAQAYPTYKITFR